MSDDLLLYTENDYITFIRQYESTTKAQRVAYFGAPAEQQMEERFASERCEECRQWAEPNDIDRFNGLCYECHRNLPLDGLPDYRSGEAAYINARYGR